MSSRDVSNAMAYQEEETLESWLNKATHPTNRQEDWEYIISFCDQINKELEGPQIAVRLLVHKIQSPQEWEALQALTVLEACMKNCGRRFHNEIGKYRFLNELIKVVSPKYMGDRVPEKVKTKIIEMLYSWTVAFPNEAKINEAYQTLRRQGLVTMDPELPVDKTLIPSPPTRPKNPVFDNEDMGKVRHWIQTEVQKVTKRIHTLEEVGINVKLLSEMLSHYDKDTSSQSDREIIKELYDRCDKLRRAAFKMATETEDNDTSLGDILQASDDLSRVINSYKKIVKGQTVNGDSEDPRSAAGEGEANCFLSTILYLSLSTSFDFNSSLCFLLPLSISPSFPLYFTETTGNTDNTETLIDLAGIDVPNSTSPPPAPLPLVSDPTSANHLGFPIPVLPPPPKRLAALHASQNNSPSHPATDKALNALSLLDDELISLGTSLTLHFMEPLIASVLSPPGKGLPVTAYDKDGVRVLLNFASDCPPCRPDVLVLVVSMLNTAPLPVQNVVLQAAVPKSMKVKLQPPSGTELPPFNPILPPASITQVMLLANPLKEKVRLRYKLAFTLGNRQCSEVGEVDQFPPPDRWGHL
uniref:Golgi associated, gamma adaptin ear containing, ARF binding protein 3 n=1 Tax=Hucho hucho TaxID=62062 RepID=A0A4W5KF34_9TELE